MTSQDKSPHFLTSREIIDKILEITDLDFNKFAIQCDIVPNTLKVSINRGKLSDDIVTKIHDKFKIRKQFLRTGKEPVYEENPTSDIKSTGNKENSKRETVYQTIVEGHTEYVLVPRTVLQETQLISANEISKTWDELAKRNDELANRNKQYDILVQQLNQIYEKFDLVPKPSKPEKVK